MKTNILVNCSDMFLISDDTSSLSRRSSTVRSGYSSSCRMDLESDWSIVYNSLNKLFYNNLFFSIIQYYQLFMNK
jgi:hypothetical protein